MVMDKEQQWLKSKLARFVFYYWGTIICLIYAVEWFDRHAKAASLVLGSLCFLVIVIPLARLFYLHRRQW